MACKKMKSSAFRTNNTTSHRTLFDINSGLATGYVAMVIVLIIVGVTGNTLIIVNMSKEKKINRHARKFILNIAVADLCVSGIANPMCIAGAFLGMSYLNKDLWICVVIASMCLTACICVFLNLVGLTINRWIFICHNTVYDKIFKNWTTTAMCVSAWVFGFGAEFPNFLGWSGHFFDEKSHQCIWDRKSSRSYTLFVAIGLITAPFVLLGYCNAAMFHTIWKGKSKSFGKNSLVMSKTISSAKTMLIMYSVFLVCWMPYVVVLLADHDDSFSLETHLFVTLLAHSHSSTTFFVYVFGMRDFKDKLLGMLNLRTKVTPQSQTTQPSRGSKSPVHTVSSPILSGPQTFPLVKINQDTTQTMCLESNI